MFRHLRAITIGWLLALAASVSGFGHPPTTVSADTGGAATPTAYLNGKAIPLADVSKYYCDDFAYPVIDCSSSPLIPGARATLLSLLVSADYVTIFDNPNFQGAWMNVSQNYTVLALIGWSDKIGSFKGRNSETGTFFTDWFYGGSQWSFCCNSQHGSLGGYDNTFSSLKRT